MAAVNHNANDATRVTCAIVTVSDTRTLETDRSGSLIHELLTAAGHAVGSYRILLDEPDQVRAHVQQLCNDAHCQAVLLTGGTGLSSRDTTFEAVSELIEKHLDGFGELFRMLSYHEIGPAAMLSRAVAGSRGRVAMFSMPGSTAAVRLAMDKLIVPQLAHVVGLLAGSPR